MRGIIRVIALLGVISMYFGCTQKSAQLQKGIAPPDKTLFETGESYLQKGLYDRARLAFQTLLNTYPDSDLAPDAYFAMGDTFYEQGGTANLLQAENQFNNFITFYQGDPRTAEALMKIISGHLKMMNTPDRDTQHAYNALREIKRFGLLFPDHDYTSLLRQIKIRVEDNLARGDLSVAEFYEKSDNLIGAMQRLEYVYNTYKDFERMDDVIMGIAKLYQRASAKTNNPSASALAAQWYEKVVVGYPFSEHYENAKKQLTALGYAIPETDKALAAANQAKIKPSEGFSPLKPLVDFVKALGFIPPPDEYEIARKTVAEEKAAAAKAAGAGASDDIEIISIISRGGDGAQTEETPAPSGVTGESPDNDPASGVSPSGGAGQQSKPPRYQQPKPKRR